MKSYDYEACAYDGECYCNECLPEGLTTDSDEVSPIFADSEWDYYPTCAECGMEHDYVSLTAEGERQRIMTDVLRDKENGEFDGMIVTDLSEVPEDYDGQVLQISDHGNATLYVRNIANGELEEVASRV